MLCELNYHSWIFITMNYVSLSLVLHFNRIKSLLEYKIIAFFKPVELKKTETVNKIQKLF